MFILKGLSVIKSIPIGSYEEFISRMRVGDIIVTQPKKPKSLYRRAKRVFMNVGQRSIITSSKVYFGRGLVIGYDVDITGRFQTSTIQINSIKSFLSNCQRAILVRPVDITPSQTSKYIQYIKQNLGMEYDAISIYTAVFKRLIDDIRGSTEDVNNKLLANTRDALFCSTIISHALYHSGWKGDFNGARIDSVYPVDFLLGKDFEKIIRYEN